MKKKLSQMLMLAIIIMLLVVGGVISFAEDNVDSENQEMTEETMVAEEMEYLYIESSVLESPGTQNIALAWDNNLDQVTSATLILESDSGEQIEVKETKRTEKAILFSKEFTSDETGEYEIKSITYYTENDEELKELKLSDVEVTSRFEVVNEHSDSAPEEAIVTLDISDETLESEEAEEQIETAIEEAAVTKTAKRSSGPIVVVIDPGHGGSDPGAVRNGVLEKTLNLKIALACKVELEKYDGVKVYLTRSTDTSLGGSSGGDELQRRINVGVKKGADLLVSIHNNTGGGRGAEIWYPNDSSFNYGTHTGGAEVSQRILDELAKLGLTKEGNKDKGL